MNGLTEEQINQLIENKLAKSQFNLSRGHYHEHNGIDSPRLSWTSLTQNPNQFCVATTTTGTIPVNVFGNGGAAFNAIFTGMYLISNDTTAGNITAKNNTATMATIAKGTTAGTMIGATSVSSSTYSRGNPITIVSDSAGNATVFLTFTS